MVRCGEEGQGKAKSTATTSTSLQLLDSLALRSNPVPSFLNLHSDYQDQQLTSQIGNDYDVLERVTIL